MGQLENAPDRILARAAPSRLSHWVRSVLSALEVDRCRPLELGAWSLVLPGSSQRALNMWLGVGTLFLGWATGLGCAHEPGRRCWFSAGPAC